MKVSPLCVPSDGVGDAYLGSVISGPGIEGIPGCTAAFRLSCRFHRRSEQSIISREWRVSEESRITVLLFELRER